LLTIIIIFSFLSINSISTYRWSQIATELESPCVLIFTFLFLFSSLLFLHHHLYPSPSSLSNGIPSSSRTAYLSSSSSPHLHSLHSIQSQSIHQQFVLCISLHHNKYLASMSRET
ncbi:hypothetical protein PENTCL1PPCAC_22344, partial [Pristionchus entomophagus]